MNRVILTYAYGPFKYALKYGYFYGTNTICQVWPQPWWRCRFIIKITLHWYHRGIHSVRIYSEEKPRFHTLTPDVHKPDDLQSRIDQPQRFETTNPVHWRNYCHCVNQILKSKNMLRNLIKIIQVVTLYKYPTGPSPQPLCKSWDLSNTRITPPHANHEIYQVPGLESVAGEGAVSLESSSWDISSRMDIELRGLPTTPSPVGVKEIDPSFTICSTGSSSSTKTFIFWAWVHLHMYTIL